MTAAKHTPGPWVNGPEFKPGIYPLQDVISISAVNASEVVAHVNCGFGRGEYNARLIKAAPEMLEALRAMLRAPGIDNTDQKTGETFRDIINAAVNKTEGR